MVITFKKSASTNSCSIEMDIEDFINLTNLISDSTREDSDVLRIPDPIRMSNQSSSSSQYRPPLSFPLLQDQQLSSTPSQSTTSTKTTINSSLLGSKFWHSLTSGETPNEITPVDSQSPDNGREFGFAELGISAIFALILPNAVGIIRLVFQSHFYATPIHFLVHNRSGFWLQDSWNPNTFYAEQSETEEWILQRMLPSICLLSLGSWAVFLSSSSNSSVGVFPVNFALSAYASFVVTHWADCSTTDLGLSALWRGLASLHLFFITFSFKRWSYVAGLSALPAFSLYSYLFFVTYKTRQKWKRHLQAIHGYDDEVNWNNSSNRDTKNDETILEIQRRQKGQFPRLIANATSSTEKSKDGVDVCLIDDWWRRKSNSRTGFATFWWNRQKGVESKLTWWREEERGSRFDDEFD